MFADKALRCECGYEVQSSDEAACVREVRQHASEAHGVDLSDELALDLVRRGRPVSPGEQRNTTREEKR
jgi:predicted small metal-binding protein